LKAEEEEEEEEERERGKMQKKKQKRKTKSPPLVLSSLDVVPLPGRVAVCAACAAAAARLRKLPLHGRSLGGSRAGESDET